MNHKSVNTTLNFSLVLSVIFIAFSTTVLGQMQRLKVSENKHFLIKADGTPFFWLADTGWEMLQLLNRDEIVSYMENRSSKGFNVIQTVIVSEFLHMGKTTNYYNDSIFIDENPEIPAVTPGNNPANDKEYDFWDHVDYAVETAESKGIYLALVPTWGEWVTPRTDKSKFNTSQQTYNYGWFLGDRYKKASNIVWILGGDRHPDERANGIELWRAMAEGIADGTNGTKKQDGKADYSTTLMTYHSFKSSSTWFHADEWIDFHMWGSYHAEVNNSKAYEQTLADWNLPSPKPTLNAEPCYEGANINYAIADNGYFTSTDVRLAAYWSVFSGSAGFTYGANSIWQFTDEKHQAHLSKTQNTWQEALDLPGATQMGYLKKLMESRPMLEMVPDQAIIVEGQGVCGSYSPAIRGKSFAFVYIPTGNKLTIKLGTISGKKIKASWFNPRTGELTAIAEFENRGERSFEVPGMSKDLSWLRSGRGCDWVLVLDDADKKIQ
jgi:hypothetical protein